ncbi:MAG: hypothetical protein VKJ46_14400 [Leptolyngbyaceae bacterium]|nr:hypothetical protein [Leptolyngbyaceae bacterium]
MTAIKPQPTKLIQYPSHTIRRAERAIRCSPFQKPLFTTMRSLSVSLQAIAAQSGVDHHYTQRSISELAAESSLLWLIQVGVLRREVDGQGLTDSFRLTPLGRQIVETWQNQESSGFTASWLDHFYNSLNRWLQFLQF